jgi:hypothetical protein
MYSHKTGSDSQSNISLPSTTTSNATGKVVNRFPGFGLPLNWQPDGQTDPQGIGLQPGEELFPNALDTEALNNYKV